MRNTVAPSASWRPYLEEILDSQPESVQRGASVALRLAHDRNIGLTPRIALGFGEVMPVPIEPTGAGITNLPGYVSAAMHAIEGEDTHRRRRIASRMPRRRPWQQIAPVIVFRDIVLPALVQAIDAVGENILFADRGSGDLACTRTKVREWAEQVDARFELVLSHWMGPKGFAARLFHSMLLRGLVSQGRGLCVIPAATPMTRAQTEQPALPQFDTRLIELLATLEPDVPATRPDRIRRIRTHRRVFRDRQGLRPREDGITGIRHSRSLDEIDGMLLGEYVSPPILRLDRMLNTGFMILDRPPRRTPRRQLLLMALAPDGSDSEVPRLTKATWIEAMLRLSRDLALSNRRAADLRWVERVPGGLSVSGCSLDAFALPDVRTNSVARYHVAGFIARSGWAPAFLDTRANAAAASLADWEAPPEPARAGDPNWFEPRLRSMMQAGLSRSAEVAGPPCDLSDYAVVHVFLILRRSRVPETDADVLRDMLVRAQTQIGLNQRGASAVSLILVPDDSVAAEPVAVVSRTVGTRKIGGPSEDEQAEAGASNADLIAAELIEAFTDLAEDAMLHGA